MKKIDLCGKWKVFNEKTGEFDGFVPGCVHTDLFKAGKIYGESEPRKYTKEDSIYFRDNAKKIQWIERENFVYKKNFNVPGSAGGKPEKNAKLVFECLDTYANITLNGIFLGKTDDMHIKYSFDVDGILKTGKNILSIEFVSAVKETENLPNRGAAFTYERLYTRREQCTYGWDWVYRFVTCGIERPCCLIFDNKPAVDHAYVYTVSADEESAQVNALVKMKNYENGAYVTTEVADEAGNIVFRKKRFVKEEYYLDYINIDNPSLWYPAGYGKQPLYSFKIAAAEKDGAETELYETKFGIRTVKILQKKDIPGTPSYDLCKKLQKTQNALEYDFNEEFSSFTLCVNGRKILCRGGNWVPCDPFISEESDKKITRLLTLARDGGFNMVRVWGGGVFEKDRFYSECDRLGILVTQDFLMACGRYPEEKEQFIDRLSKEAECAAIRLRNHPCLMWWSGDNENAVNGSEDMESYSGREAALKGIAPMLRKYDFNRYFLPSSPYGGKKYASKTVGTTHNTQFLGTFFNYMGGDSAEDYKEYYREYLARFIAEEPSFGTVNTTSLRQFMTEEDIFGKDESMWYFHTQTNPGVAIHLYDYLKNYASIVLGKFTDSKDRLFKTRYLQCEWVRIGMEMIRRNMFFSSGIIYWMLNDCWPASTGWAFIDYYCRVKDSYYSFKRCSESILASIDRQDGKLKIYLSNTDSKKGKFTLELSKIDYKTGKILGKDVFDAVCGGDSACEVRELEDIPSEGEVLVLDVLKRGKLKYRTFYREGSLPMSLCGAVETVKKSSDCITLKASGYVQSVFLDGDYIFDDNCFVMLPGEERTVGFKKNICFGTDACVNAGDIEVTAYGLV